MTDHDAGIAGQHPLNALPVCVQPAERVKPFVRIIGLASGYAAEVPQRPLATLGIERPSRANVAARQGRRVSDLRQATSRGVAGGWLIFRLPHSCRAQSRPAATPQ
jgi:hypothetical protein